MYWVSLVIVGFCVALSFYFARKKIIISTIWECWIISDSNLHHIRAELGYELYNISGIIRCFGSYTSEIFINWWIVCVYSFIWHWKSSYLIIVALIIAIWASLSKTCYNDTYYILLAICYLLSDTCYLTL